MKTFRNCSLLLGAITLCGLAACASPSSCGLFKRDKKDPAKTVDFERDIRPLLEAKCLSCHHTGNAMRDLNLETLQKANTSWRGGPVIVAKHPQRSMLLQILELDTDGTSRSAHAINFADREKLTTWISEGAEWPESAAPENTINRLDFTHMTSRRRFLLQPGIIALSGLFLGPGRVRAASELPFATRFKGVDRFNALVAQAAKEKWVDLPIGERIAQFGKAMRSTPYVSYTLEIDDHIEAPSVNFNGLDCWSFFEISLGMARMIARKQATYTPEDLLREIQFTRYRGGVCTGNYLERIHYLEEWFFDDEARGVVENITRKLGHAQPILGRKCQEMTILWKTYRYLRNNPEMRPKMGKLEETISQLPVYCIPKDKVHLIEKDLKNGDILGIATKGQGSFCSHVGLACRTDDGVLRIMHASSQKDFKRVVVDKSISDYLKKFSSHLGVIVARAREIDATVTDYDTYRANLEKLTGGRGVIRDKVF